MLSGERVMSRLDAFKLTEREKAFMNTKQTISKLGNKRYSDSRIGSLKKKEAKMIYDNLSVIDVIREQSRQTKCSEQ